MDFGASARVLFECNNRSGHEKPQSVGVPAETLTKDLHNTSQECLGTEWGNITSTHKGRQRPHTQVERTTYTYRQGAKRNHNNGLTYGKQHVNTQAATE
jgi:hypothetical protein